MDPVSIGRGPPIPSVDLTVELPVELTADRTRSGDTVTSTARHRAPRPRRAVARRAGVRGAGVRGAGAPRVGARAGLALLALLAAVVGLLATTTGFSSAAFVRTSTSTATVSAAADWTPPEVSVASPGATVRGSVTLSATASDAQSAITSVALQTLAAGASSWTTVCTDTTAPYSCAWDTTAVADGSYEVRARVTNAAGYTATSASVTTAVANDVTLVLTDPGAVVRGGVPLTVTRYDGSLSNYYVTVQRRAADSSGAWETVCGGWGSGTTFGCTWASAAVASGTYDLRVTARYLNLFAAITSPVVQDVVVDNTAPTVAVTDPGSPLRGQVAIGATAADAHSGVTGVTLQRSATGTSAWTDLCTDTTAPYSCVLDTTALADGSYGFRAVATDAAGNTTTSATVANRRVENTPLLALDVQTANGSGTAGRLDAGDTVTFTYSQVVAPATLTSGWSGSATAVQLRLRDGSLVGSGSADDAVDVQRGGTAVQLGSVALRQDYVNAGQSVVHNATMTASTVTVDGTQRTVVTVTVGALASGSGQRTVTTPSTMIWTPSTAAATAGGTACSAIPATESGASDREF